MGHFVHRAVAAGDDDDPDALLTGSLRDLGRPNIIGAISGRAVYEGKLDLRDAVARLNATTG